MSNALFALVGFGVALSGCGGGAGTSAPAARPLSAVAGTFVLTVPTSTASSVARSPRYISPSAVSVSIAVSGLAPVVADISGTSPNCTTSQTGRTCTIPVTAPPGRQTFTISQYDRAGATGNLLGTATAVINVVAGFHLQTVLNGSVASITLALGTVPPAGTAGTTSLVVQAFDADDNLIIGPGNYTVPITLTLADTTGQTSLSTTSVTGPSQANVTITYAGGLGVSATITATASGAQPSSTVFAPSAAAAGHLYAANLADQSNPYDSITVTPANANGNAAPSRTISGPLTGLNGGFGVAVDSAGFIYGEAANSIVVFAPGANGNVAPVRTITGVTTGSSLAIDPAGELVVPNASGNSISFYAPGASVNATPTRTIAGDQTGLFLPFGVAFDSAGNLYVVNGFGESNDSSITVYGPTANGNVAPIRAIGGVLTQLSDSTFDAVDSAGRLYVSNYGTGAITVYAPGAQMDAAPIAVIAGTSTELQILYGGLAIDASGSLYVTAYYSSSVLVFASGANGNVAPIRDITGSATGFLGPQQITLGP